MSVWHVRLSVSLEILFRNFRTVLRRFGVGRCVDNNSVCELISRCVFGTIDVLSAVVTISVCGTVGVLLLSHCATLLSLFICYFCFNWCEVWVYILISAPKHSLFRATHILQEKTTFEKRKTGNKFSQGSAAALCR